MSLVKDPQKEQWMDVRNFLGGWDIFDDASIIADNAVPDITNMVYDGGLISPRKGSTLRREKPASESLDPLQLIIAHTSDGVEYTIAIYGNHFYLEHEENDEWVRINTTYVPAETDLFYGYQNWNNGRGDDRLYACNGVDDFIKWHLGVSRVSGDHLAAATTLTLEDGTRFPSTGGSVVVKGNSGEFVVPYTSRTGNVLTLTGTLGQAVGNTASVAMEMEQMSGMEIGKVVSKHQGRLIVANYYGGETVVWYSKQADPEDFTTGSLIADAGTETISDGNGEITGAHDFGEFLVIEKEDSLHKFAFKISEDLASKLTEIVPIISGQSLGPIGQGSTVKVLNSLFYPTKTEGYMSFYPSVTGGQSGVAYEVISQKIQPYVLNKVGYTKCRGVVFNQKCLWALALDDGTQNILVLVYDTLRKSWTKFSSWAVQDWGYKDGGLMYLDNSTGDLMDVLAGGYHDNNNPYLTEFFTKRYDYGALSKPKTQDFVYVQGYLTPATELYVDVLFNEGGILEKQTYLISKDTDGLLVSQPLTNAAGEFILGQPAMGWVIISEIGDVSFFRGYLGINNENGFYNLQLRFYSNKEAFWGITGVGFDPVTNDVVDDEMIINPI